MSSVVRREDSSSSWNARLMSSRKRDMLNTLRREPASERSSLKRMGELSDRYGRSCLESLYEEERSRASWTSPPIVQHFSGVFERAAHLLFPVSGITVVQKKNGRQEVGVQREDTAGYIFREQLLEHLERLAVNIQRDITARTGRIIPGGTHCEASWERQIPFFMNTLLYEP